MVTTDQPISQASKKFLMWPK